MANRRGLIALHVAAAQGHERVIGVLLRSVRSPDAAINAVTQGSGATALHLAVTRKHVAAAQLLLRSPRFQAVCNATTTERHTALHLAVANGCSADMVQSLLDSARFTADAVNAIDALGRTALHIAAERGDVPAALQLQRSRKFTSLATACHRQGTALDIALRRGHQEMIELLQM